MNDISESTVYVRSFQFETLPIIFSLKESKSTFHIPSKCFALYCVSTLTKTAQRVWCFCSCQLDHIWTRTRPFSRNFIRIVAFRGTLACHSFACLSYFCGFHFLPAITIIPHSSRKDSNHKQEPTFMASSSCYYCSYLYCSLDISYLHVLICNIFFKGIK